MRRKGPSSQPSLRAPSIRTHTPAGRQVCWRITSVVNTRVELDDDRPSQDGLEKVGGVGLGGARHGLRESPPLRVSRRREREGQAAVAAEQVANRANLVASSATAEKWFTSVQLPGYPYPGYGKNCRFQLT